MKKQIILIMKIPKMLRLGNGTFCLKIFCFQLLFSLRSASNDYLFVVEEASYTRLCSTKNILTVNGQFPGPTIRVFTGDTIFVEVSNEGKENITIHWHGVRQPRYPWSDGPAYITQCPIKPGASFRQKIIFSEEEGTLWWHAHSDWSRATVHGAIIIQPRPGTGYPFPEPHAEVPIILGEWWKQDVTEVRNELLRTGGQLAASDAFTINGQPGDLYPCSSSETFTLRVDEGKTYLLRIINAAMGEMLFFSIANHDLTVVGADGAYTSPLTTNYITISPGQTLDVLLQANQNPNLYYMASSVYSTAVNLDFINNTTATAVLQYNGNYTPISSPPLPYLPSRNDTNSAFQFIGSLRSLANEGHPIDVPLDITTSIFSTVSLNTLPCENDNISCEGPNGTRLAASLNNQSFVEPSSIAILEAYYERINGVYGEKFPDFPPYLFNFTADDLPMILQIPEQGTEVKVLDYDSTVEINFQGTNLVAGTSHPIHLHGYSFFVVGFGFGNFDEEKDPLNYNLIDPPLRNIVDVPISGWATVRFRASNPGVWFMHCHREEHLTLGMKTVFIVKNGESPQERLLPPPPHVPPC